MANIKITDLAAYTAPETTDVMLIVDVTTDTTKKVAVGEVVGKITGDVDVATDGTSSITAGAIVDADVSASAAIAGTKIAPDFGSQTIQTTGIQFNGDTAAANALNDYEEGTFTPTVIGTTVAGTGTYTYQVGAYTKVGRLVTFTIAIAWTAHTGTGSLRIDSLPFASGSVSSDGATVNIRATSLPTSANHYLTGAQIPDSSTQIIVHEYPVGGGAISGVAMDSNATIWVTGSYYV